MDTKVLEQTQLVSFKNSIQLIDIMQQLNDLQKQQIYNFISHPMIVGQSQLIKYSQSHTQQTILNIIESLGTIIAQVLAIEKFQTFTNKTKGLSVHLLSNEISEKRRHFVDLEDECKKNQQQEEWQLARDEFKKLLKNLEDLLINKEHKLLLQNILQPPPQQSSIIIQPDKKHLDAIESYHYRSQVIFHNSLQKDKTGEELLKCIITYRNGLAKFLYFQFIEQGIKDLDLLLNYVLINKTQGNHSTLQQLNEYIQSLFTKNDKQQLMKEIQLIIVVFPELAEYFQELQNNINDNSLYFDNRIELNPIQFEYVLLIYDHLVNPRRKSTRKLTQETIVFMKDLDSAIRAGSVQGIKSLLKNLNKNIKQEMLTDFEYLSELAVSSKLRLFMKMIQQINVLKEHDIKDDYLNFQIVFQYDRAIFNECKNDDIYHEPSAEIQQIKVQQVLYQFTQVIENAADLEKNLKNDAILEKLKTSIKESTSSIESLITSAQTINKLLEILNCIFFFQKLNVTTFLILYQYFSDLKEIQQKIKNNQCDVDQIPNLYKLLLNFQYDAKQQFQKLLNEKKMSISEERAEDLSDLIKEVEQFDRNNAATFLNNVKQYYNKELKDFLLKLAQIGTKQFQEAVNYLIQQVDP
ncbi:unnamed protein product (macronuclear) [Paramecium tetraurelia]|uniref:Uncharacterized protein n=1 Tax=Paramecium tetraurelia TaxID=5888 RepID=A0C2E9_PARTE|nr:uncharacterized protein GSPATT00034444001 [Paramecium tetraurelia]CAK64966.1 unnamed protein product [Paramecium tetraurelia]|eukprot:XP_001432363.1 hypothetical protein (macronuclear) [Paramecium tetraurelia strain d4-2]